KGMIERRRPAQLESRMLTPQWALDRAADLASTYVEAIRDSGVHVVGNLDVLSQRYQAPPTISDAEPTSMPISAAISAILGAMDGFRSSEDQSRPKRLKKRVKKLQVALRSKGRS
ncbi:MAG: hypothetical protein Q8L05_04920, partial [Actinomycetota bacterium]|nr:hypothetical protein [Actinomycetota bacterium]